MNFLVRTLAASLHLVSEMPEFLAKVLGSLRVIVCYWKTLWLPIESNPCNALPYVINSTVSAEKMLNQLPGGHLCNFIARFTENQFPPEPDM